MSTTDFQSFVNNTTGKALQTLLHICGDNKDHLAIFFLVVHLVVCFLCFRFGFKNFYASSPSLFNLKKVCLTIGATVLLATGGCAYGVFAGYSIQALGYAIGGIEFGVLCTIIGLAVVIYKGEIAFCGGCSRLITTVQRDKRFLSGYTRYRNVTRHEPVRNRRGERVYTIERSETVPVAVSTHRNLYECPICHYQWVKVITTER